MNIFLCPVFIYVFCFLLIGRIRINKGSLQLKKILFFIFLSIMYIGIMLVVDILYGIIDPRIRLSKEDSHES